MSKFWAKVRIKQDENAEHLIRAFFHDFNPASSIVIRGREAKLEIVFENPPMEIIDAIGHCEVVEMNYGKNLKEYDEDETMLDETENDSEQETVESDNYEQTEQETAESEESEQTEQETAESEDSEQTKQETAESEDSKQTEQPKRKRGRQATKKKVEPTKEAKTESKSTSISIPELDEIAKKSSSFEDFAKLVAEWLEMDKRQEFFKNLVIVSAETDMITWKELENALMCKNVFYKKGDKVWVSQQVSKKMKEHSVTILPFLQVTRQYKEYPFEQIEQVKEQSTEENPTEHATEETVETAENVEEKVEGFNEEIFPKPRLKMECMPEIKEFEEVLASVDKTQPVEDRVRYVLKAMGLNKLPSKEQKQIIEIASTAVRKERIAVDIISAEANIPTEQAKSARMTFSKFVNDFVQKYESDKKVKLLTFLSELQKIIMFESEIEKA